MAVPRGGPGDYSGPCWLHRLHLGLCGGLAAGVTGSWGDLCSHTLLHSLLHAGVSGLPKLRLCQPCFPAAGAPCEDLSSAWLLVEG